MTTRRHLLLGAIASASGALAGPAWAASPWGKPFTTRIADIERDVGGWLGVAVIDTASGVQAGHRMVSRLPMCSTFKVLAAGAILKRVDERREKLDRRIKYSASDVVVNSPSTEKHVDDGMTLAELCEAAITLSDNTAGNLLLANIGGPKGLTGFARSLGDRITRLDRTEPTLNEATPGDPRDTTAPEAMAGNLKALVLGNALSAASREHLTGWLTGNKTGDTRLRAGMPGWRIGDKTGSGEHGTANDLAVIWPPGRAPVIAAVYLTNTQADAEHRNGAIADVGRAIAKAIG
jgi:beta-lactamase class A